MLNTLTKEAILKLPINTLGIAGAKDISSYQWIWTTNMAAKLFHYPSGNDLVGVRDWEVDAIKNFSDQYIENDKLVISNNGGVFIESVGTYRGNVIQAILTKTPYYEETHKITGIFWSPMLIESDLTLKLINSIQQSMTSIYGKHKP